MYKKIKNSISVKKIADFLDSDYTGNDFYVNGISSLNNIQNNTLLFYSELSNVHFKIKDNVEYDLKKLEDHENIVVLGDEKLKEKINVAIIPSKNPRLDFERVIMKFFVKDEFSSGIHKTAIIENDAEIGNDVYVGSHCYIGNDVKIGDGTKILQNTCIYGKTIIGSNSVIKSNTTVGSEGFSFSIANNEFFHFPHLGSIIIGDHVWIGSNCALERAQMDQTIIEDHVKIDDMVNIAHNTTIKKFTQITVGSIICGRAKIGQRCWIAPNSIVDTGCEIGDDCFVGASSLVRKNFPDNSVIFGTPARFVRKNTPDTLSHSERHHENLS